MHAGIKVLEIGGFISGPYCTMLLADFGAEVIKVESPEAGDPFRVWDPGSGDSPTFRAFNRSKKSLTLDITKPEGRDIFLKLVERSDVLVENLRAGKMESLGLSYKELSALNEKLVYCAIDCFGSTGAYSLKPGFDTLGQAMSGLLSLLTEMKSPKILGPALADHISGLFASYGITNALLEREKTGKGAYLEVSLLGSCMALCTAELQRQLVSGKVQDSTSRAKRSQAFAFVASDGKVFTVHLSSPEKFWNGLLKVVGLQNWIAEKKYPTYMERIEQYDEISSELKRIFVTKPRDVWLKALEEQDVPCTPLYNTKEVLEDKEIAKLGMLKFVAGKPHILNPINMDNLENNVRNPPNLGEHTEQLLEDLGLEQKDIQSLRSARIV